MIVNQLEAKIEQMTIDDLEACWTLDQRCFPTGEAYDRDMIKYLLLEENNVCYKFTNLSNTMIGFVIGLIEDSGMGHIVTIAIAPEIQAKGYGRRLIQRLEEGFRLRDVTALHLEVRVSNKKAQHLYTKQGYLIVERIESYYPDGEDAFLMVKSILDLSPETYE